MPATVCLGVSPTATGTTAAVCVESDPIHRLPPLPVESSLLLTVVCVVNAEPRMSGTAIAKMAAMDPSTEMDMAVSGCGAVELTSIAMAAVMDPSTETAVSGCVAVMTVGPSTETVDQSTCIDTPSIQRK